MTSTSTVNICLRVLKEKNKNSSQSYFLREVPLFDSVRGLKEYLLERYREELFPAADTSFRLGYFGDGNMKFSITSEIQLGEALSLVKKGMVTLWVDPHLPKEIQRPLLMGKKRKAETHGTPVIEDVEEESTSFNSRLSRLREKHGQFPEFKLQCWARMLVNGTHKSEDTPPDLPFSTGKSKGFVKRSAVQQPATESSAIQTIDVAERKVRMRSGILQQLKDLKALSEEGILSESEFASQKQKLLQELKDL